MLSADRLGQIDLGPTGRGIKPRLSIKFDKSANRTLHIFCDEIQGADDKLGQTLWKHS